MFYTPALSMPLLEATAIDCHGMSHDEFNIHDKLDALDASAHNRYSENIRVSAAVYGEFRHPATRKTRYNRGDTYRLIEEFDQTLFVADGITSYRDFPDRYARFCAQNQLDRLSDWIGTPVFSKSKKTVSIIRSFDLMESTKMFMFKMDGKLYLVDGFKIIIIGGTDSVESVLDSIRRKLNTA
jgi:hypothetical protein